MAEREPSRGPSRAWFLVLALLHAALGLWALHAWIHGPFQGRGVVDGYEVLRMARTASAGPFETKGPLYPWVLSLALRLDGNEAWTIGILGIALSLGVLAGVGRLCSSTGVPRAAPWAMAFYALSGSAYAFLVQPLPAVMAALFLVWGAVFLAVTARGVARAFSGGALLAASALTRAPLAVAAALLGIRELAAKRWARAGSALFGAMLVAALGFAGFGARAWPAGSAFNLRQGNGGARSGFCDVRPGPAYERARYEAAFAPPGERGAAPEFERYQRAQVWREVRADPGGAALTLLRKAFLLWHRTETVTGADFRHGLRDFAPFPVLLLSYGVVAPLALASLLRRRPAAIWLPVLGVFLVNVVWLTSARYRFPALPFLCAAAGSWIALRPRAADVALALALALPLNLDLSGWRLVVPGDGLVQEGHLLLEQDRTSPRARDVLERAVLAGDDPRAEYELALAWQYAWAAGDPEALAKAEEHYRAALALDPLFPQAVENLIALLKQERRWAEALQLAYRAQAENPYAGGAWLAAAEIRRNLNPGEDTRALEAQGHAILALRALAMNDQDRGRMHASRAKSLGSQDPRLAPLLPAN
jgi:hypothetical protein